MSLTTKDMTKEERQDLENRLDWLDKRMGLSTTDRGYVMLQMVEFAKSLSLDSEELQEIRNSSSKIIMQATSNSTRLLRLCNDLEAENEELKNSILKVSSDSEGEKEEIDCVAGCKSFYGGEKKHHKDCPYYEDSLSKKYDEMERNQPLN